MSSILDGLVPEKAPSKDGTVIHVVAEKHTLAKALNATSSAISGTDTLIPVLKNFHLRLTGTSLRVTGSNGSVTVIREMSVLSSKGAEGDVVFPSQRLQSIVSEAPGELEIRVVRKSDKYFATVKSGTAKWTMPLPSPEGFPDLSAALHEELQPHPREEFLNALKKVRKAVSMDPMRPYLNLVDVHNGKVRASDSIRFQQVKHKFPFDCQIPQTLVHELVQRLTASNEENFHVGQTKNALLFRVSGTLVVGQKLVATFPDVDEVILKPTFANDLILKTSRSELLAAIRRVRILADETTSAVVLSLNHGSVSIESKDRQGGVSVEEVEAVWEHAPRHVSFNHKHLMDMLASSDADACVFRLGKDLKTRPTAFLMEDEAEGFTAVLNQIRLDWM